MLTSFARIWLNSLLHVSGSSIIYMEFRDLVHLAKSNWAGVLVLRFARVARKFFASSLNLAICMSEIIPFLKPPISCVSVKPRMNNSIQRTDYNKINSFNTLLITSLKVNLPQKSFKISSIVSTRKGTIGESVQNRWRNLFNLSATSSKKGSLRGTRACEQLLARCW